MLSNKTLNIKSDFKHQARLTWIYGNFAITMTYALCSAAIRCLWLQSLHSCQQFGVAFYLSTLWSCHTVQRNTILHSRCSWENFWLDWTVNLKGKNYWIELWHSQEIKQVTGMYCRIVVTPRKDMFIPTWSMN